jgi:hypothetical protein
MALPTAYCVKMQGKGNHERSGGRADVKNGRPATKGVCPNCGTKVFKIGT